MSRRKNKENKIHTSHLGSKFGGCLSMVQNALILVVVVWMVVNYEIRPPVITKSVEFVDDFFDTKIDIRKTNFMPTIQILSVLNENDTLKLDIFEYEKKTQDKKVEPKEKA